MKILYVDNLQDSAAVERRDAVFDRLFGDARRRELRESLNRGGEVMAHHDLGEIHVLDFNLVRQVLPIRTAPCVFLLFDDLEGQFPADRIEKLIAHVNQGRGKTF